jgi:TupA-like ATPgrasp
MKVGKFHYIAAIIRLKCNSRKPITFNEKIQYKSAHDRRPILTIFADKIQVKEHISKILGSEYAAINYAVNYNLDLVDWKKIPNEFVFKVNHGSKGIVIVSRYAKKENKLPTDLSNEGWTSYKVHPESLVKEELIRLGKHWLTLDYHWYKDCGRMPEWAYKNIKKGALFEELLNGRNGESPEDYKFHMFNGKCSFINVIHREHVLKAGMEPRNYSNLFTEDWREINVIANGNPPLHKISPPKNLPEMLEIAEKLANGIDYLRVDLYSINARILIGELTNYPMAGQNSYEPASFDYEQGSRLILDRY